MKKNNHLNIVLDHGNKKTDNTLIKNQDFRKGLEKYRGIRHYHILKEIGESIPNNPKSYKKGQPYLNKFEALRVKGLASIKGVNVIYKMVEEIKKIRKHRRTPEMNRLLTNLSKFSRRLTGDYTKRQKLDLYTDQRTFGAFYYDTLGYQRSPKGMGMEGRKGKQTYQSLSEDEKGQIKPDLYTIGVDGDEEE